jgi:hypothetical protein
MHELWRRLAPPIAIIMVLLGSPLVSAHAAPSMSASDTQFSKGVVDSAVSSPSNAQTYLQSAIQHFGTSTNGAVGLVSLFADEIGDVSSCDAEQAKELATALQNVLKDPANSTLVTQLPTGDLAIVIANAMAGGTQGGSSAGPSLPGAGTPAPATGTPTASTGGVPAVSAGAFGSFGSSAGTGVATSPAT